MLQSDWIHFMLWLWTKYFVVSVQLFVWQEWVLLIGWSHNYLRQHRLLLAVLFLLKSNDTTEGGLQECVSEFYYPTNTVACLSGMISCMHRFDWVIQAERVGRAWVRHTQPISTLHLHNEQCMDLRLQPQQRNWVDRLKQKPVMTEIIGYSTTVLQMRQGWFPLCTSDGDEMNNCPWI